MTTKITLTVKFINSLKPKKSRFEVREGNGFLVKVFPTGRKVFYLAYKFNNTQKKIALGKYPTISLKQARDKANELRRQIANGIDPIEEKQEAFKETIYTVGNLGKEFVEQYCKNKRKSWKEDERILNAYILKSSFHRKLAKDVRRRDIMLFCDDIANNRGKVMANRVFSFIRTMFNYAVVNEILEFTPCVALKKPGGEERRKQRYLKDHEIVEFWQGLENSLALSPVSRALKLILLTGQRPGEVCGICSSEINGRWWTIPGERTKNGRDHSVYLTDLALELIGDAEGPKFVSPVTGRPIYRHQLSQLVRRKFLPLAENGSKAKHIPKNPNSITYPKRWTFEKFTPHDLRRTCATHLVSLGFNQLLVGHILNHTDQSVTAIYNQYSYDKEKQQAMEAWEARIKQLINDDSDNKVIEIHANSTT